MFGQIQEYPSLAAKGALQAPDSQTLFWLSQCKVLTCHDCTKLGFFLCKKSVTNQQDMCHIED